MPLYRSILSIKQQIELSGGKGLSTNDFTDVEKLKLDNFNENIDSGFANSVFMDNEIIDSEGA